MTDSLEAAARAAQGCAYAPYSRYRVGAALEADDGTVFAGCNVENASYGATICAERGAIARMVASGGSSPIGCVIVTGGETPAAPCGICRQVLAEFAKDMPIILVGDDDHREETTLDELLPRRFEL